VQDATEVGIAGATVNLLNAAGTVINTTTTNASGAYSFANLAPGTYGVSFSTPATYTPTGSNLGGNDATDSDPVSGTVTGIVLTAGQTNNTIDAGFYIPASIGNYVWNDVNANGIQDATEVGIAGVNMSLTTSGPDGVFNTVDDVFQAGVPTDANGYYAFTNLKPGDYRVWANKLAIDASSSIWAYTTSINAGDNQNNTNSDGQIHINLMNEWSNSLTINLIAGETDNTIDFGMYKVSSIGNYVWNDVNANGVQDATEVGIAGATVNLLNATGTVINTTTTNASGAYSFTNLAPGTYGVGFVTPTGYSNASPANLGGNDATDSDPVSGTVTGIILTSGQTDNTIDAGFYNCLPITSGINGPLTICAAESALFTATGAGSGSVYTWAFMSGTPATATGSSVTSSWSTPGEYDINLTVTKNGCTASYLKSIIITQSVFAGAGPDAAICSGGNTTLTGSGPAGSTYSWTVVSGDPTSIDNGASQASALVSPLSTTTYMLTVTQNGCTRTDQVIVNIDVNKNPTANAGPNKTTLLGTPVVIGGSPTGTPPLASPGATLGYIWSAATGLNSTSIANPSATLTAVGTVNYQVIVYSTLTGCSDTSVVAVTALQPVNVGNYVWYDKNDNGIKEVGEPAVNTTVNLYKDDNNDNIADGAAIATMATVNGVYNFGNLYPGNYIVGAIIPTGYAVVTTNGGDPDNNTDNDNNGTNTSVLGEVRSSAVTLLGGSEPIVGADGDDNNGNLTVDFGFKGTAALGNFVWYDSNRDGVQDAAEIGIPNAIVTLTYPDGGTVTTNTNSLGAYSFTNLAPGTTYSVAFTTPTGYTPTVSNSVIAGATDANDSDPIGGVVSSISLVANQVNNTIDAGFHNSCSSLISGNIWHDTSAMANNMVDSIGSYAVVAIPNALRVYLVSNASGKVIKSALVSGNGVFNFANVLPGSYYILLSTIGSSVGADAPSTRLPTGWRNTGEKLGLGTGRDLQVNGILNVSIGYECVNNANFGIKFRNKGIGID
ncbi:MAG: SdrD B-like domain-containing protein, partial [Ferruginibacter sp.]